MLTRITRYGSVKSTGVAKKTGSSSAVGHFSELLEAASIDETVPVTQLSDVAAASAVSNMLSLQEISDEDVRRKKLVQQGKNMLDVLENLRQQLLIGHISAHTLQDLNRQLSIKKQSISDPRLMEVLEDIELRVAVELAKLEQATGR